MFDPNKLLLIAGPCSLENEKVCRSVADALISLRESFPMLNLIFKGSFDKANRTSLTGLRGPGIDEGLELLALIKKEYNLPVTTDVHLPDQCETIAKVCDVLQIPAFLCRQTDLLVAAGKTGRVVNVKKGQFLSPQEMAFTVDKLKQTNATEIWQTERGSSFGYQNLVVDMRSFSIMAANNCPTILDATHSVQLPGAAGGQSGGQREFIPQLARAGLAAGAQGLFIEAHPNPSEAISDKQTQIPLQELPDLIASCVKVWEAVGSEYRALKSK